MKVTQFLKEIKSCSLGIRNLGKKYEFKSKSRTVGPIVKKQDKSTTNHQINVGK